MCVCVCFQVKDSDVDQCNRSIRDKFESHINSLHFKRSKCCERRLQSLCVNWSKYTLMHL